MEKYGKSFKEMAFKEKIKYLWEYYRITAFWTVVGAVIGINFLVAIFTPPKTYAVDITLAGQLYSSELEETSKVLEEEYDTSLSVNMVDWNTMGQMEMAVMQKIPLLITTKQLDILGIATGAFDAYLQQTGTDMFIALDTIPAFKELIEEYKDQVLVAGYNKDEDFNIIEGEQHVYGFKVNAIDNIPGMQVGEEITIGVTTSAKDIDKTVEMMRYLLEDKQ